MTSIVEAVIFIAEVVVDAVRTVILEVDAPFFSDDASIVVDRAAGTLFINACCFC